jgi:hypothetical protein
MSGNVFKDNAGQSLTKRIDQTDVESTVKYLEGITGLSLTDNMLGTTGRKPTSGDLDLAVDEKSISKGELENKLKSHAEKTGLKNATAKSGISVHFLTPINGDPDNGFVQTDFMFGDPEWMKFSMAGEYGDDGIRGQHRHILLNSIGKARVSDDYPQGLKWSYNKGLVDRATEEVVTKDPNTIAKMLLGQTATADIAMSFPKIMNFIKKLPNYEDLTADARPTLAKQGIEIPDHKQVESYQPGTIGWMRQMIDIVS